MKKNELISVIVPCYNSEKYIEKCIESILNQTYENKEIIIVDDGSLDNTVAVVKKYGEIKIVLANHGGSGAARNIGIDHAKGKYVVFIDSDDYIDKDYLKTLITYSTGQRNELIMCGFRYSDGRADEIYSYMEMNNKETIFSEYLRYRICNKSVDKLYTSAMLKNIRYPEGRDLLEDVCFTAHILENCDRLVRLPYVGYCYVKHENSLSSQKKNPDLIAGKYSNILEKYVVLSRNVSKKDYDILINEIIMNVKNCLNAVKDIYKYEIFDKMKLLLGFVSLNAKDKKDVFFGSYLSQVINQKELKKKYAHYSIFHDSFANKAKFIKSSIRKVLKFK